MKRHLSTLLQRKRAEFDSTGRAATPTPLRVSTTVPAELNGYDWLQRIKGARVVRASPR